MLRLRLLVLCLSACTSGGGPDTGNFSTDDSTGSNPNAQCGDTPETPAPGSGPDECHTAELVCGDQVTHTTVGGQTLLSEGYNSGEWACIGSDPLTADYSGPERRYYFTAPEGIEPTVTLNSRCDLTLKVVRATAQTCPTDDSQVACWDAQGAYTDRIQSHTFFPGYSYEIIVESVDGSEGAFTLDIEC